MRVYGISIYILRNLDVQTLIPVKNKIDTLSNDIYRT